jgi:two-component system, cell cycle sensor histidine kinase and response regulator CckA
MLDLPDQPVTAAAATDAHAPQRDRFDLVALATQDLVWDWDLESRRVEWAGGTLPFFGCLPADIARTEGDDYHAWASRVHPDDLASTEAAASIALDTGADAWEHEYRFRRADGSWARVLERATIVRDGNGRGIRVVGAIRDVSRQLENDEAKNRLAAIVTSSGDAIVSKTLDGIVTSWNSSAERLFGYTAEEMVGRSIYTLIPEELHESERVLLEQLSRGERVEIAETERIRKDGSRILINLRVSPIWDGAGRLIGASSIKRDITAQKRAQTELRRREERYRALVTATSSLVWEADPEGRFLALQRSWEEYTGQSWDEQKGFGWLRAFHPDDRGPIGAAWAAASDEATTFEASGLIWNAPRQAYRHVQLRAVPILDSDEAVREWIGMLTDIEAQWTTEERLRQAERMEVIGRLAGGVAHEVNNQMTVVLGASGFLVPEIKGDRARDDLESIRRAAQRTASITRQLLAYSRRQLLQPQLVDLNAVIGGLRPMLERALGETATLALALDATMHRVNADPGQLELVLLNLVLNARDAMPHGGSVRIETCTARVEGSTVPADELEDAEPGTYAMLSVSDTGEGMGPETLRHVFEPFFTTKGVGEGTGLGLATVYGIVKQSGGFVTVSSQLGQGTTFRIYLPMEEEPTPAKPISEPEPVAGGKETVLVVEDEANVREFLARALRQFGYTVIEAANGSEGLREMRERPGGIALVVSDIVMPGISGREFAGQALTLDPAVRVLLISGYPGRDPVEEGRDPESGLAFLQKPVAPTDLARAVREMLDAK